MMRHFLMAVCLGCGIAATVSAQELQEISVVSSIDQTSQPSLMFVPPQQAGSIPLLVLLHTWSGDYHQKGHVEICLEACATRGWALLHPNFRGANFTPQACGSDLAVQDIIDAIDWMSEHHDIDRKKVYLTGVSGGGHMSLLMAGRHSDRWAAVSAWVGISDLQAWHAETKLANRKYFQHMEQATGGAPGESDEIDQQYQRRSPSTWFKNAKGVPIDINAGIHDGHTGSVPISHSLQAFNQLATVNFRPEDRIDTQAIAEMTASEVIPDRLIFHGEAEDRQHRILFRRQSGPVRVTIFEGGHEGDLPTAIRWLENHSR